MTWDFMVLLPFSLLSMDRNIGFILLMLYMHINEGPFFVTQLYSMYAFEHHLSILYCKCYEVFGYS